MALAWAWGFMGLSELGLGQEVAGFQHLEDSYQAAMQGGYQVQTINVLYNGCWDAVHHGRGLLAQKWYARLSTPEWSGHIVTPHMRGLVRLHMGHVREAVDMARAGMQAAREAGHQKQVWRCSVLLAHALAENMQPELAVAELPPISSRVEGQDAIYDTTARIRTRLAQKDLNGAFEVAHSVQPEVGDIVSPAEVVAEVAASDPAWLRWFLDSLAVQGETLASPRIVAARARLALYEGRLDDALIGLRAAVAEFEEGGLMMDARHVGRSLGEAEARSGDTENARTRLAGIVSAAESSGAHLAARLARETAAALGLVVPAAPEAAAVERTDRVATGERMVSVLFADVRGYTQMSGAKPPDEMLDRISSLQRWSSKEVARRRGLVDKFAGDALMATFNVSGQSVDHTLQALQAAIAIIDKAALAGLPVGAGIAVGPAVVGSLAESAKLSVLGEVTNLAARLQAQSVAGEVTLSEEAHRRVSGWLAEKQIRTEPMDLRLKGFEKPVAAYRVLIKAAVPSPT
jgi:adenylate cyclase